MKLKPAILLLFLPLIVAGCTPSGHPVTAVTGTVHYQGNPVEEALVSFIPTTPDGVGAGGTTDENGRYILLSQGAQTAGALKGDYIVCVTKVVPVDASGQPMSREDVNKLKNAPHTKNILPDRYATKDATELKATVTKGKNVFPFELND